MKAGIQQSAFGKLADGTVVDLYTLTNSNGLVAKLTNFGAIITELHVPDRKGQMGDVVLGFDNLDQYLKKHPYFGSTVGRVANRIARGKFKLDGKEYSLPVNNGPNSLHGGISGFDKKVWQAEVLGNGVRFKYTAADGEEGYPGKLETTVVMTLTDANELRIDYTAVTDKPTPINLTNHSYFNFRGSGTVLDYELTINADSYTPVDAMLIPTGEIRPVKGTPLDFTAAHKIGVHIPEMKNDPPGYDNNFVLNNAGKLELAACAYDPVTGRQMETLTTQPGVQFYTGNFLDGSLVGKNGFVCSRHTGFCLETQHFPDSVNHPNFPSTILRPGETYRQTTIYKFSAK